MMIPAIVGIKGCKLTFSAIINISTMLCQMIIAGLISDSSRATSRTRTNTLVSCNSKMPFSNSICKPKARILIKPSFKRDIIQMLTSRIFYYRWCCLELAVPEVLSYNQYVFGSLKHH